MTRASEGSQEPKMSRNVSTFSGFTICEMTRPRPNRRPAAKDEKVRAILDSHQVPGDEDSHDCCRHEHERRGKGAGGGASNPADPMATCAAGAKARAEPDEKTG